jgi:hypothetical protein
MRQRRWCGIGGMHLRLHADLDLDSVLAASVPKAMSEIIAELMTVADEFVINDYILCKLLLDVPIFLSSFSSSHLLCAMLLMRPCQVEQVLFVVKTGVTCTHIRLLYTTFEIGCVMI